MLAATVHLPVAVNNVALSPTTFSSVHTQKIIMLLKKKPKKKQHASDGVIIQIGGQKISCAFKLAPIRSVQQPKTKVYARRRSLHGAVWFNFMG